MAPGVDEVSASVPAEANTGDSGLAEGTNSVPAEAEEVEATDAEGVCWNTVGSGVCGAREEEEGAIELNGTDCAADAGVAGVVRVGAEAGSVAAGGTEVGMTDSC